MAAARGDGATRALGAAPRPRPRAPLRGGLVARGRCPATPTRSTTLGTTALPAVLDRRDADGGRARPATTARPSPASPARPRRALARGAPAAVLRRRLRPLPHRRGRLRRIDGARPEREADLHAQHGDHGRRRGQLRPPRPDQQQRFTTANRRLQLPDPDEQPGAMPEIAPSPLYGRSVDKKFTERASVLQAWGAYGTAWPVVHQQLGVRPDLGRGRLEVVPQPPSAAPIAGSNIRLGGSGASTSAPATAAGRSRRPSRRTPRSACGSARRCPPARRSTRSAWTGAR